MAEQKTKPVAKKVTTTQKGGVASGKPKTAKIVKKTVAKKTEAPAVKKAAAPAAKKKTPAKKTVITKVKPTTIKKAVTKPTPEERYRMVETAAYYIAERHGFQGRSDEHWAAAELEIATKLGQ